MVGAPVRALLPEPPSHYFRRQVFATFQDDRVGVVTRDFVGVENLMWASDFPHSDGTYPHTRKALRHSFHDKTEKEVRAMVGGNAAALYGFDLDALAPIIERQQIDGVMLEIGERRRLERRMRRA